jgi:predicted phosphodiesterase
MSSVLILPDTHLPASSKKLIEKAAAIRDEWQPDIVVQLGDLIDAKAWSRFAKSSDDDSAALEWEKTEKQAEILHSYFPDMIILEGNHDVRLMRKACQDAGIPAKMLKTFQEIFGFKGWKFHNKTTPLIIDNVAYIHGDEVSAPLSTLAQKLGRSVVRGHTHQGGLLFTRYFDREVFAMECGALIDETHNAFGYASKNPRRSWIGIGLVEDGKSPHLISLG